MKPIPATTRSRYLTGAWALNIPAPEQTTGDWHFQSVFFLSSKSVQLAGEGEGVLVNTNALLGEDGVHECGATLRSLGIALADETPVYSANHYRAILDLLVASAQAGESIEHLARPEDWLDRAENVQRLVAMAERIEAKLQPRAQKAVAQWRTRVLS